MWQLTTTTLD